MRHDPHTLAASSLDQAPDSLHLLLPLQICGPTAACLRYAQALQARRWQVHISLLYAISPALLNGPLPAREREEWRADELLGASSALLQARGLRCQTLIRYAALQSAIRDSAEQLDCNQIVIVRSGLGAWLGLPRHHALGNAPFGIPVVHIERR